MPHRFHSEQLLPYPVEVVFAFFADPENLPRLMPAWQQVRLEQVNLVAPLNPTNDLMQAAGKGSQIEISFRPVPLSPVRIHWLAEISEFEANSFFCDQQLRGPFHSWRHCHRVRAQEHNGQSATLLVDEIEYELAFGSLGRVANALFVRRQLQAAFAFRHMQTVKLLALQHPAPSA
jgi:ligand-binding SRPBCC domain-containing protein